MLDPGEIVDATVERIVQSGVIVRARDARILILATEAAQTSDEQRAIMGRLAIGQVVRVRVTRYVEEDSLYVGSMKSVQSSLGPELEH